MCGFNPHKMAENRGLLAPPTPPVGVTSQAVYRIDFTRKLEIHSELTPHSFPHYLWAALVCLGTQRNRISLAPKIFAEGRMRGFVWKTPDFRHAACFLRKPIYYLKIRASRLYDAR